MASRQRAIDVGASRARTLRNSVTVELRNARLAAGLSQIQVGSAVGLSRSQLSRIERGLAPLDVDVLARAFAILGMELSVRVFAVGDPVRDAG